MIEYSERTELDEAKFVQKQVTEAKMEINGKRDIIENELKELNEKVQGLEEALQEIKEVQLHFTNAKKEINGKVEDLEKREI